MEKLFNMLHCMALALEFKGFCVLHTKSLGQVLARLQGGISDYMIS
jgi:hypothetical protein